MANVEKVVEKLVGKLRESGEKVLHELTFMTDYVVLRWEKRGFTRSFARFAQRFPLDFYRGRIVGFTRFPRSLLLQLLIN